MDTVITALELLIAVAIVAAIGKRLPIPLPILFVAAGLGLTLIPRLGAVALDPAIFFLLFIPPLLFADGWLMPKREFFSLLRPILLLAFGLVALTVVAVGYFIHWLVPAIPLAAAFALGAIVSPTDAVAASAVTEKLRLPRRVVNLINGESLINDASGLVAFKFAVAAIATGTFSLTQATVSLAWVSIAGVVMGVAVAWFIGALRNWLEGHSASEPAIQAVLSILTPFAAYLAAESVHVSGILAIVAAGLYAGHHDTRNLTLANRIHTWEVWSLLLFAFNGLVFLLLGLQLPRVFAAISDDGFWNLVGVGLALTLLLIGLRMLWMFPGAWIPRWLSRRIRESEPAPTTAQISIVGWTGIRGAVTLAAALSIPLEITPGVPFPGRDAIIFLAGCVILVTLLLGTLTLGPLVRWLDIKPDDAEERETQEARLAAARAAIVALQARLASALAAKEQVVVRTLIGDYEDRLAHLLASGDERRSRESSQRIETELRCVALSAERDALMALHAERRINEEVLRVVQRELDYWESAYFGDHAES